MSDRFRLVLLVVVLVYFVGAVRLSHRKKLSLNYALLWLFMLNLIFGLWLKVLLNWIRMVILVLLVFV